jgi:hypothetical protein
LKPYKHLPGFKSPGHYGLRQSKSFAFISYNENYADKFYEETPKSKFIHITIFDYLFSSLAYILLVKSLIAIFKKSKGIRLFSKTLVKKCGIFSALLLFRLK